MIMNLFKAPKEMEEEEEVKAKPKPTKGINFRMCSECGLPQESKFLNGHWKRKHG